MPRFAGMLMAGLGMNIFGIVLSRTETLYPRTLLVRAFFLVCIATFYAMTRYQAKAPELKLTREEWYELLVAARGEPLP